jgi:hypothetical protein
VMKVLAAAHGSLAADSTRQIEVMGLMELLTLRREMEGRS